VTRESFKEIQYGSFYELSSFFLNWRLTSYLCSVLVAHADMRMHDPHVCAGFFFLC
jgi:hypothetical protein